MILSKKLINPFGSFAGGRLTVLDDRACQVFGSFFFCTDLLVSIAWQNLVRTHVQIRLRGMPDLKVVGIFNYLHYLLAHYVSWNWVTTDKGFLKHYYHLAFWPFVDNDLKHSKLISPISKKLFHQMSQKNRPILPILSFLQRWWQKLKDEKICNSI